VRARSLLAGVGALGVGALLARAVDGVVGVDPLLVGIAVGVALVNGPGVPAGLRPGVGTHKLWLGAGIVVMGATLSVDALLAAGGVVLVVVAVVTTTTVVTVEALARLALDRGDRLGSLLAAGAGICGVSAVVAVGAAVRAREAQIAYAAATVLLFDAVTIVVYPVVGDALGLSGTAFGVWAGASMFSTGPVVAVGVAHSDVAGRWATVTKLSRNALIGAVVLGYASYYARVDGSGSPSVRALWTSFPKFVVGFLGMALLASVVGFSPAQRASLEHAYSWLFLLAFVGLGTEIQLDELRETGVRPALVVLAALLVAAALALAAVTALL